MLLRKVEMLIIMAKKRSSLLNLKESIPNISMASKALKLRFKEMRTKGTRFAFMASAKISSS